MSVCHKPRKVLGTGVVLIAVNILKTKMSTHREGEGSNTVLVSQGSLHSRSDI